MIGGRVVLTMLFLVSAFLSADSFAFEPGEQVYVKFEKETWAPAQYVVLRNDCLSLKASSGEEHARVDVPSNLVEGTAHVGSVVYLNPGFSRPKERFVVEKINLCCHAVNRQGTQAANEEYILLDDLMSARDYRKLIGISDPINVGDIVYAQSWDATAEEWAPHSVISRIDNCYATDSDKVLHYEEAETGLLFNQPAALLKPPQNGDQVVIHPSYRPTAWEKISLKIKSKQNNYWTLLRPYVDAEDYFEERVKVAEIKAIPSGLSGKDFLNLKPGVTILEYMDPQACDYPYYQPHTISSNKRTCYLLELGKLGSGGRRQAYLPDNLIASDKLN